MNVPDFAYTVPSTVTINTNQDRSGTVSMAVSENAALTGVVETTAFPDAGDPAHPVGHDPRADHLPRQPDDTERHGDLGDLPDDRRPDGIYTV